MQNLNILVTLEDTFSPAAKKILERVGKVDHIAKLTQKKLAGIIGRYDVACIGLGLRFDKNILEKAKCLKVLASVSTGLDHIDLYSAQSRGVVILSLKEERSFLSKITGTAELAFGLLICLFRHIPQAFDSVRRFKWDREKFRGHNLSGKVLGIIGMGRLGIWMTRYAKAFQMEVIFFDPYIKKSPVPDCRKVSFHELLIKSDVISLHLPLNQKTEYMIKSVTLRKMKRGVYLINTSRGNIVKEKDLLKALQNKRIGGYAADVLSGEPFDSLTRIRHPLIHYARTHGNIILVPHIGGMTFESRSATDIFIAEKVVKFLAKRHTL